MSRMYALLEQKGGAETMITVEQHHAIHALKQQGWKIKRIARELGLARNTVKRTLHQPAPGTAARARHAATLLDPWRPALGTRLATVGWNARRLFQDLRAEGYAGSYDTVKVAVRPLRQAQRVAEVATVRFETPPGHQAQVDWGSTWVVLGASRVRVDIFAMTLGYSRFLYAEGALDQTLPTFLTCHGQAFEAFGGIPRECLYDNPKTVVLKHDAQGRPLTWNPHLQDFAGYYGFTLRACPLYRARTKGKDESAIKYLKRNFLPGRTFTSLADFNRQLAAWLATIANVRRHGTTHQRPVDRLREERPSLLPWGSRPPYVLGQRLTRTVAHDCLVDFETNRYSVPAAYVGRQVEVRLKDPLTLECWCGGQVVATHARKLGRHEWSVNPAHWAPLRRRPAPVPPRSAPGPDAGLIRALTGSEEVARG